MVKKHENYNVKVGDYVLYSEADRKGRRWHKVSKKTEFGYYKSTLSTYEKNLAIYKEAE